MTHASVIGAGGNIFTLRIHINVINGHRVCVAIAAAQVRVHRVALVIQQIDSPSKCAKYKKLPDVLVETLNN